MQSFEDAFLDQLRIPHSLIRTIRLIGEYKGKQELYEKQAPEILENLRQVAIIQSIESSNRIEGITADPKRIQAIVQEKTTPQDRSEGEIAGYRDVLNTIHSSHNYITFKDSIVLQLHRDLMKYAGHPGGKWKSTSNEIMEYRPDGTKIVRFKPVAPHLTPEYMRGLHERYNKTEKEQHVDSLILIPLYVLDFLCIHPFLDGNGRMARLLTVLMLYHDGYHVGRYISLEKIIEQTKDSYYDTLQRSSFGWHEAKHDVLPWLEYFLGTLLAAYRDFEARLGHLSSGYGSKVDMVLNAIDGFIGDFTIADLEKACPLVGRDWIRALLQRLKKEGKLESLGKGRYARWHKIQ